MKAVPSSRKKYSVVEGDRDEGSNSRFRLVDDGHDDCPHGSRCPGTDITPRTAAALPPRTWRNRGTSRSPPEGGSNRSADQHRASALIRDESCLSSGIGSERRPGAGIR